MATTRIKPSIITPRVSVPKTGFIEGSQLDTRRGGDLGLQDALLKTAYNVRVPRTFSVRISADVTAVTGDGTVYTPLFDTEVENEFDLYDIDNNQFVAKEDGFYLFILQIQADNVTATAKTLGAIGFGIPGGATISSAWIAIPTATDEVGATFLHPARLSKNDTLQAKLYYTGGSADVAIRATKSILGGVGGAIPVTRFSGFKLSD